MRPGCCACASPSPPPGARRRSLHSPPSPMFVLPVQREGGHFVLLSQVQDRHCLFTYLEDFKRNPATAQPYMTGASALQTSTCAHPLTAPHQSRCLMTWWKQRVLRWCVQISGPTSLARCARACQCCMCERWEASHIDT